MTKESKRGFTLLTDCTAADTIPIKKFQSVRTGLTIIAAGVPGPLVCGSFYVATEAHDDDGLPHTLEHLIFLGSADYPFKGCLDLIANRCLASGTNAWTDTDHTGYTVETAGSEGFLALLPVYLDHLFFPTLTDAGFITEVYHITGEGRDSGVVFCEMQSFGSSDSCIIEMESLRGLYKQNSGYRYETGGAVSNLRYSTTNEKVHKFHKQFYCPLNTTIVVAGPIDIDELLDVCYKFEEKLIHKSTNKYEKAWQTPVEPLEKSIIRAVTYASDEEDYGSVTIAWQGPSLENEYYKIVTLKILFNYLSQSGVSPLKKYFVETCEPYCSEISVNVIENSIPALAIQFENAVIDKIPFIHEKLMELLQIITNDQDESYKINKTRMKSVIEKNMLEQLLTFEKNPHEQLAYTLVKDTLYGKSEENLADKFNFHKLASRVLNEPIQFWISLINDHLLRRPSVTVLGYPWKNQHIINTQLESERLTYREATLGIEGLKKKGEAVEEALKENQISPPDDLISKVPVPHIGDFKYHSLRQYTTSSKEQHPNFDLSLSPVYTQLDDIDSKFIYTYVIMDSRQLPKKLRLYLTLFLKYILACPVKKEGQILSHEEVAGALEQDLITIENCIGLFGNDKFTLGSYSYTVLMNVVMIQENFENGLDWIRSLLFDSVFTRQRLQITVQKVISSISQIRRQGFEMLKCVSKLMQSNSENHRMNTVLSQLDFLTDLSKRLEDEKECESIIADLEEIRSTLTSSENMILHLSMNVENVVKKFANPSEILSHIIPENAISNQNRFQIQPDHEFLSSAILGKDDLMKSCVIGMASEDSSFMYHATKSICDFHHPDLPSLSVYIQYLIQLEGPLWRTVRGSGYAYSYKITANVNEGILSLLLYRSSDIVQAFKKTREVVFDSMKNPEKWNYLLFESGKSSLIFQLVELEKNISGVSKCSLLSHFRGLSRDYRREFIKKVQDVKLSEMKCIADKYMKHLFDPIKSLSTIVCHNSKTEEVAKGFSEMGHKLVMFQSLEDSYLNPSFLNR